MRRICLLSTMLVIVLAALSTSADSSKTAQGIGVLLTGIGSFTVTENKIYHFNQLIADSYFTNSKTAALPSVSCNGSPTNCATANQPNTPTAPVPDPDVVSNNGHGLSTTQKCIFLNGGVLSGTTYQQGTTVNGKNGKGSWTFIFSYSATPNQNPVAPFTAWLLFKDVVDGSTSTDIGGFIAGESVVQNSKFPNGKYSFSLDATDPITGEQVSRVKDLALYIDNELVANPSSFLQFATPGVPGSNDFAYLTNAGSYGYISLLKNGSAVSILNTDDLAGNNNGGSTGKDLARAVLNPTNITFSIGEHTVKLTGTVKGNGIDLAPVPFTVSGAIHIVTPGCNGE